MLSFAELKFTLLTRQTIKFNQIGNPVQSGTFIISLCCSEISSGVNSFASTSPQVSTLTTWHSSVCL